MAPKQFRELLFQRRRWYVGLMKNLWAYKHLYGFKKGPLGTLVLPVAASTIILSIFLTSYIVIRTLTNVKNDLLSMQAINFRFNDYFEFNDYIIKNFIYNIFSSPVFLLSLILICLIAFYLTFSRRHIKFKERMKGSFILFILFYSLLFAFWWLSSIIYLIFNRKIKWREEKYGKK